jgi:hypothetical protein
MCEACPKANTSGVLSSSGVVGGAGGVVGAGGVGATGIGSLEPPPLLPHALNRVTSMALVIGVIVFFIVSSSLL